MLCWLASIALSLPGERTEILTEARGDRVLVRLTEDGSEFARLEVRGQLSRDGGPVRISAGADSLELSVSGGEVTARKVLSGGGRGLAATESWVVPGRTVYSEGGFSAGWSSPGTMVLSGSRLVVMAPVLPKALSDQILEPLLLSGTEIGLARGRMVRGELRRVPAERPVGERVEYSYRIGCREGGTVGDELSRMWRAYKPHHADQAFPQTVPFGIAMARTCSFTAGADEMRKMDLGGQRVLGPVGLRWVSERVAEGRIGWPRGQAKYEFGLRSNALRSALGVATKSADEVEPTAGVQATRFEENVAAQVSRRLVAASPSGGFVRSCDVKSGAGVLGSLDEQAATAVFALRAVSRTKDEAVVTGLRSRVWAVASAVLRSRSVSAVRACLLFDVSLDEGWQGDRSAAARYVSGAKAQVLSERFPGLGGAAWKLELLARAGMEADQSRVKVFCLELCRHQALWDRGTDGITRTFGSFSENIGGISADSGVVAAGLIKVGAKYMDLELIDRGAFGVRNQFGLWHSAPLYVGLEAQRRFFVWQGSEGVSRGDFLERKNWEGSEGLKVAILGEVAAVAGGLFVTRDGVVGIDGTSDDGGRLRYTLGTNPMPNPSDAIGAAFGPDPGLFPRRPYELFQTVTTVRAVRRGVEAPVLEAIPTPGSTDLGDSGRFWTDSWQVPARVGATGWVAQWPEKGIGGVVRFSAGGGYYREAVVHARPMVDPRVTWPAGWRRTGDNWWVQRSSVRADGAVWMSTGDDGCGGEAVGFVGTAETPSFLCGDDLVDVWLRGGDGCYLEVVDVVTGEVLQREVAASVKAELVTLNFTGLGGRETAVRLVDRSRSGLVAIRLAD